MKNDVSVLKNKEIMKISKGIRVPEQRVKKLHEDISKSLSTISYENQDKISSEIINIMFGNKILSEVIDKLGPPQKGESKEDFIKRGKAIVENLTSSQLSRK